MARTEGNNQPDLLNVLRAQTPPARKTEPPVTAPAPSTRPLHPALTPHRPSRTPVASSRNRDLWILGAIVSVVAALVLTVWLLHPPATPSNPAKPSVPPGTPAKPAPRAGPAAPPIRLLTPGKARSFNTLVLAAYPVAKETEARSACAQLKTSLKDLPECFLYRKSAKELWICTGSYEAGLDPLNKRKAGALQTTLKRTPNAAGYREFSDCHFNRLSVSEPQ